MEKDIIFANRSGRKLHGILTAPEAKNFPLVIICHGYASSIGSRTRLELSRQLLQKGIASFGFDFTGSGKSEGELHQLTVSQGIEDLTAAYGYVKKLKNVNTEQIGILGSSFSGSVAVLFAAKNKFKALALKSPVSSYSSVKKMPMLSKAEQKRFFNDAAKYDIYSAAEKIMIPTIIVHGSNDDVVPVEQSKKLFSHLKCKKKLAVLGGADHQYSDSSHFSHMASSISKWFSQNL